MINNFQVIGNFLSRLEVKVKCHQNLVTFKGDVTHISTSYIINL